MSSGDDGAHARTEAAQGPRRAFVLARSFKNLRSPVKAPQKLIDGLRLASTIALYSLTLAIVVVYGYLIATKGGASK